MSQSCLLENIRSSNIIDKVFDYASSSDIYKLTLIKNCKSLQKKLNIDLNDYKYLYLNNIEYQYHKIKYDKNTFDKKYLYNNAESALKELNISFDEAKDIIAKNKEKYKEENNDSKEKIFILEDVLFIFDIYAPFLDVIIKYSEDIFININLNYIKQFNLIDDYKSFFEKKYKNSNLLYVTFGDIDQLKLLKEMNIDFSLIKALFIKYEKKEKELRDNYGGEDSQDDGDDEGKDDDKEKFDKYDNIFSELFSLENIGKSLETLSLHLYGLPMTYKINNNIFNSLNNLKSLKHIYFDYLTLNQKFIIKLDKLETIHLESCKNIYLDNNTSNMNVKYLYIKKYNEKDDDDEKKNNKESIDDNYKYRFPNIEELYIYDSEINIDFSSLTKLKKLGFIDISLLENIVKYAPLEKFIPLRGFNLENEKKIIDIIFNKKTLKDIRVDFGAISNEDLHKIKETNDNINNLNLKISKYDFDIQCFLQKFNNLKELSIISDLSYEYECIEIEHDEKINVEKVNISVIYNKKIYFSFSAIQSLFLTIDFINVNTFPLFNEECDITFSSLRELSLDCTGNESEPEALYNMCKNLDKCLKLEKLNLNLIIFDLDNESYLKFVEKIVSKRLRYCYIFVCDSEDIYTMNELNEMFPNKIRKYINNYRVQKIE